MQVKSEVFFSFRKLGRLLFGEPLVGVETPTVGADLCVRPSSPERSLSCGRTRRSAPTRITLTRQLHSSNAVTPISVGADLCVRPSSPEHSLFCGRTRRSAPTRATSARQFHPSDAVTPIFVGADLRVRPSSLERCMPCVSARPHLSAVYSSGGHAGPPLHKLCQHDNSTHQTL